MFANLRIHTDSRPRTLELPKSFFTFLRREHRRVRELSLMPGETLQADSLKKRFILFDQGSAELVVCALEEEARLENKFKVLLKALLRSSGLIVLDHSTRSVSYTIFDPVPWRQNPNVTVESLRALHRDFPSDARLQLVGVAALTYAGHGVTGTPLFSRKFMRDEDSLLDVGPLELSTFLSCDIPVFYRGSRQTEFIPLIEIESFVKFDSYVRSRVSGQKPSVHLLLVGRAGPENLPTVSAWRLTEQAQREERLVQGTLVDFYGYCGPDPIGLWPAFFQKRLMGRVVERVPISITDDATHFFLK